MKIIGIEESISVFLVNGHIHYQRIDKWCFALFHQGGCSHQNEFLEDWLMLWLLNELLCTKMF